MTFDEWHESQLPLMPLLEVLGTSPYDYAKRAWEAAQAAQREQDRRALESAQRTLLTLQDMPELGRLREGIAAPLREIAAAIRNQEKE